MPEQTTFRPLTVPSAASKSNSFALGKFSAADPIVPVGVLFPSSLRATHRLKFQVSHDDSTYYDTLQGTAQLYITETLSKYVLVPDLIQQALLGWEFIRVATMDASNVDEVTNADFVVEIHFSALNLDNAQVADPNNSGAAVTAVSIADGSDVAEGITTATAATATDATSFSVISLLKGILKILGFVGDAAVTNPATSGTIGSVLRGILSSRTKKVRATLASASPGVLAAAGDYTAGDVMNNSASAGVVWIAPSIARNSGEGGMVRKVEVITSVAAAVPRLRLHLFNASPSAGSIQNDNVAMVLVVADAPNYLGYIDMPALQTSGSSTFSWSEADLAWHFQTLADANLYFVVQLIDGFSNESAAMTMDIFFSVEQE